MERIYELTDNIRINSNGVKLYQIKALKANSLFGIRKGELGGWVESYNNLNSQSWVTKNVEIFGNGRVLGCSFIDGNTIISDGTTIITNN